MAYLYTIKLDENYRQIFIRLAEERKETRAKTFRWLLSEAAIIFLDGAQEPEPEKEHDGN